MTQKKNVIYSLSSKKYLFLFLVYLKKNNLFFGEILILTLYVACLGSLDLRAFWYI